MKALQLRLFYRFSVKSVRSAKKRILIVKNDSIGDYIISRNFLAELKRSEKFRDHELFLMTSKKLAPIARELDGPLFKEIILSNTAFASVDEQLRYFRAMKAYRFAYVLHPTYSPDSRTHYLVKFIAAPNKVGFVGDTSNQTAADKLYFEPYYTQLVRPDNLFSHEFEKNRAFFEAVLERPLALAKPELKPARPVPPGFTVAICPGAQHAYRIWSPAHFGELITHLKADYPALHFAVVTGPGEDHLYDGIAVSTPVPLRQFRIDSTMTLVELLAASQLVVCNDSSAAHIAVAGDVNNVCVSNGNHFGRFIPYPQSMPVKQQVVLPPKLLEDLEKGAVEKYYAGSQLDINTITVHRVLEACRPYLRN